MANVVLPLRTSRELSWGVPLARLAVHDWVLVAYHATFLGLTVSARERSLIPVGLVAVDLLWLLATLVTARRAGGCGQLASSFYRASLVALPLVSYLQLRWILPVVAPSSVDETLLAFDLRVFGFEPALTFDRWVNPVATEWFSFFYYSYFVILAVHAIPLVLFAEDSLVLREFTFGLLLVFCVGQLAYVAVPGFGPHAFIEGFATPLEGAVFWPLVEKTVTNAGAGADIFPSLHTAVPVFLTCFSYRHRRAAPFHYSWPVMAFVTVQIVIATMYLRWHWLADILAGIALGVTALGVARAIASWEGRRREGAALGPTFAPPLRLRAEGVR